MTQNKYPEEIYRVGKTDNYVAMPIVRETLENAYDLGLEYGQPGDPLLGWSNLTRAIEAGESIDWERLDGVEAKCVHPELGTLTHKLERDVRLLPAKYAGWYKANCGFVWSEAFCCSWEGSDGWSLYIKGEIPLVKKTADQLELGTCFRARRKKGAATYTYPLAQLIQVDGETRVVCFNEDFTHIINSYNPDDIEVLEIYGLGTFPTPKEDA